MNKKNLLLNITALVFIMLMLTQCQSLKLVKAHDDFYRLYHKEVEPNEWVAVRPDFTYTGLSLTTAHGNNFDGVLIAFNSGDTVAVTLDEHYTNEKKVKSNMVMPSEPQQHFYLYTGTLEGLLELHLLNAREKGTLNPKLKNQTADADCEKPSIIPPESWRDGLPDPTGTVIATDVNHIILHHTATSNNSNLSSTEIVRNIYLDHTQVNGWNDIGYNYLVSGSGEVFGGRDGRGIYERDNVRGAHFCGENSGTMGIGLIGTYTNVLPPDTAIQSTLQLMSWKLAKENIRATDHFSHPANPDLSSIAGHRDGCSTICPGGDLYAELDNYRQVVESQLDECIGTKLLSEYEQEHNLTFYPNPAINETRVKLPEEDHIRNVEAYSSNGQSVHITHYAEDRQHEYLLDLHELETGLYWIKIGTDRQWYGGQLLVS